MRVPASPQAIAKTLAAKHGFGDDLRRLSGGRTNAVWQAGDHVIKVFAADACTPLFGNDGQTEYRALCHLGAYDLSPAPMLFEQVDGWDVLAYKAVDGLPSRKDLSASARLLSRLHNLPLPNWLPPAPIGSDVLQQAKAMDPLLDAVDLPAPDMPPRLCFAHRDPIPANFVGSGATLRLIDWQCPGAGDPIEDIAHFLSPAMALVYGDAPHTADQRRTFLTSYQNPATVHRYLRYGAAYHLRMAAYCTWQTARGQGVYRNGAKAELALVNSLSQTGASVDFAQGPSHVIRDAMMET